MRILFDKKKTQQNNRTVRNRGAAMIVVVCVMAIVMILSLTLLMVAYQMLATVNDEGRDELYYQQAMSFSEVLRDRLQKLSNEGSTSDPLVGHINDFVKNVDPAAPKKETLVAEAKGVYGGITLTLDKSDMFQGNLVITISVSDDEKKVMSSCICKYEIGDDAGKTTYKFRGYYNHWD